MNVRMIRKLLVLTNIALFLGKTAAEAWCALDRPEPADEWKPPAPPVVSARLVAFGHYRVAMTLPLQPEKRVVVETTRGPAVDPNKAFLSRHIQVKTIFIGPPHSAHCQVTGVNGLHLWWDKPGKRKLTVDGRQVEIVPGRMTKKTMTVRLGGKTYALKIGGGAEAAGGSLGAAKDPNRLGPDGNPRQPGRQVKRYANTLRINEDRWQISGLEQQHVFSSLSTYLNEVGIVPHRQGGRTVGLRVSNIEPTTYAYKRGFRKGDVITQVNNYKLDSVQQIHQLKNTLRNSAALTVYYTRNGQPRRKVFKFTR